MSDGDSPWGEFRTWVNRRMGLSTGGDLSSPGGDNAASARILSINRLKEMMAADSGSSSQGDRKDPETSPPGPPGANSPLVIAELNEHQLIPLERDVPLFQQELVVLGHRMRAYEREMYLLVGGGFGSLALALALFAVS